MRGKRERACELPAEVAKRPPLIHQAQTPLSLSRTSLPTYPNLALLALIPRRSYLMFQSYSLAMRYPYPGSADYRRLDTSSPCFLTRCVHTPIV